MIRKVMVTGGAGFIGSELVRQFAKQGTEVIAVDNLVNGKRENLEGLSTSQVRLATVDIRDTEHMVSLSVDVDIFFHLACMGVRHSIHSPDENHEVNATATLHLLSIAKAAGIKRFVYVSTSEVYGTARFVPMTEDHPTFPETVYGSSKLAGECYARAFHRTYGYPTVVVRPFNTYGPRCHHEGDSGEVIPKFILHCLSDRPMVIFGDGTQTRDFTFVSDTARGIREAGLSNDTVGRTINLGSGREISINDLARKVADVTGHPDVPVVYDPPRPGDVMRLYANIITGRELIGFEPEVTLREGLIKVKDWYLSLNQPPERLLEEEIRRNWELKRNGS